MDAATLTSPRPAVSLKNRILLELPESERDALLTAADRFRLAAGQTLAHQGDHISSAYFPETGVIASLSELATGHQVAIAAIGREGVIGMGPVLGVPQYPYRMVVLADSVGYRVSAEQFSRVFQQSEALRRVTLAHVGRLVAELTIAVACHRAHSHRQRLARWLLTTTDKAGTRSLRLTHEILAQMVGGPRHAVTMALNQLRAKGAIDYLRGSVDIIKRSVLVAQSCECYTLRPAARR